MVDPAERPPVRVGHAILPTADLSATVVLMRKLGMRPIESAADFAVLESRGGTHLLLRKSDEPATGAACFDLMVDGLDATHARLDSLGLAPTPIQRVPIHDCFTWTAPSGHVIVFDSTHDSIHPV